MEGRLQYVDNSVGMSQMIRAAKVSNVDITFDEALVQACQALAGRVNKINSGMSSYWRTVVRLYMTLNDDFVNDIKHNYYPYCFLQFLTSSTRESWKLSVY